MIRHDLLIKLKELEKQVSQPLPDDESGTQIKNNLEAAISALESNEDYQFYIEDFIYGLITYYPNLTPLIPRELIWAAGGSCLHFLGDEEIEFFSKQEEQQGISH